MTTPQNIIGRNIRVGMHPGGFTKPFAAKSYIKDLGKRREMGTVEIKQLADAALAKRGLADQMTWR